MHCLVFATLLLFLAAAIEPANAVAQSLRGSRASVQRMHRQAVREKLHFYETTKGVNAAVKRGRFERLVSGRDYAVTRVSFPYALPAAVDWLEEFSADYRRGCGERLVVTSGMRPTTRQPSNSSARSVHPTGIALDLRKPRNAKCLRWLRNALLSQEKRGLVEATEERNPAHFHVAVFPTPYQQYAAAERKKAAAAILASNATGRNAELRTATYEIRAGDSLWDVARRHGTTVARIRALNDLSSSLIRPGQQILLPVAVAR